MNQASPSPFLVSPLASRSGDSVRGEPRAVVVAIALIPATGTVLDCPLDVSLALQLRVAPAQNAADVLVRRFLGCDIRAVGSGCLQFPGNDKVPHTMLGSPGSEALPQSNGRKSTFLTTSTTPMLPVIYFVLEPLVYKCC